MSKSGGNTYHGTFYQDYQDDSMQGHNIDEEQIAHGLTGRRESGASSKSIAPIRGATPTPMSAAFLVRDKLWWYGSYRYIAVKQWFANYPAEPQHSRGQNFTGKFTYQPSNNNKFIGYFQRTEKLQINRLDALPVERHGGHQRVARLNLVPGLHSGVWKAEYNRVMGNNAFAEVARRRVLVPFPDGSADRGAALRGLGTRIVSGGNQNRVQDRDRPQVLGSLSYFKDNCGARTT